MLPKSFLGLVLIAQSLCVSALPPTPTSYNSTLLERDPSGPFAQCRPVSDYCDNIDLSTCDAAAENLDRTKVYRSSPIEPKHGTGVCKIGPKSYDTCGIFLANGDCSRTGQQMYDAYWNLVRPKCNGCGHSQNDDDGDDECQVKVDYVSGCTTK